MGRLTTEAGARVRTAVGTWPPVPDAAELNALLRYLGRWRSQMLANTYFAHHGARIHGGPFAGMEYLGQAAEGALIPRLLGTYESELHPHLERFLAEGVDCVVDVGCAEGYYAVGLARRLPRAVVYAYDISPHARQACAALAQRNGVADRVVVRETFRPHDFETFADRRALVVMDVEGAEAELLRPDLSPALAGMRLIVETHDPRGVGLLEDLRGRFEATHEVLRVDQAPKTFDMPDWLRSLPHLDQLLAVWEWRGIPTPWLVMRPR